MWYSTKRHQSRKAIVILQFVILLTALCTKRHQSRKAIVTRMCCFTHCYHMVWYQTTSKPKGNCDDNLMLGYLFHLLLVPNDIKAERQL